MGRTTVLMLIAILFGVGASWLAYQRVNPNANNDQSTTPVVVAAFDIPYGTKVEAAMAKVVAWPKDSVPEGAFTDINAIVDKLAATAILSDDPLTAKRLVDKLGGSALASLIEPEKRAMTIRVNDVIGVGGFLLPGNRVDVLASRIVDRADGRAETRTLLQNLKVLAVDQQARTDTDKDEAVVVRAVTVEVDPKQAEQLTQAVQEGALQLVLRNPLDSAEQNLAVAPPPVPAKKVYVRRSRIDAPASDPNTTSVTVIRGTSADTSKAQR